MSILEASVEGIGLWGRGLPSWQAAVAFMQSGALTDAAPNRPAPQLLAPNERRRAPDTVAVALEAALSACQAAGRDPSQLPSVFTSHHGEIAITDYMCAVLADDPATLSPTRFHNSVHNAAAGYWTIGAHAHAPATALSAGAYSFAQGLLEAMVQLATDSQAVLLVGYDSQGTGPLAEMTDTRGLLGGALVLARDPKAGAPRLRLTVHDGPPPATPQGPLSTWGQGNAMAAMLPVFERLAGTGAPVALASGPAQWLELDVLHG